MTARTVEMTAYAVFTTAANLSDGEPADVITASSIERAETLAYLKHGSALRRIELFDSWYERKLQRPEHRVRRAIESGRAFLKRSANREDREPQASPEQRAEMRSRLDTLRSRPASPALEADTRRAIARALAGAAR